MMKLLIIFLCFLGLGFGQNQRTVRRFTGTGAPGNILGSGYGDIYVRTSNSSVYFCTKIVGNCNGVSSGNWVIPYSSPTTTQGDLIRRGASADERLAVGSEGALFGVISGLPAYSNASNIKMDASYLYSLSPPLQDNTLKLATMFAVQREILDKTLAFTTGDAYKVGRINAGGTSAEWNYPGSKIQPYTFSYPGGTIVAGWCSVRWLPNGGYLNAVQMKSINPVDGTSVSGSATIALSMTADTGADSYSNLGSVVLSSATQVKDTTLSGFTRTIPANRIVKACITSASGIQHLVVSPEIW